MKLISAAEVKGIVTTRTGETKLGESIRLIPSFTDASLETAAKAGARFALIGVPEDIGVRANFGRPGAAGAWNAFLHTFLNTQRNDFFNPGAAVLVGAVDCEDLQKRSEQATIEELRALVEELDQRVTLTLAPIFKAGLVPIVIGGGHNNALGIIRAAAADAGAKISCVNLDAHADFRPLEGRHSGNPFSYATKGGLLEHYCVLGLQELFVPASVVADLKKHGATVITYEDFAIRRKLTFEQALASALTGVAAGQTGFGVELDCDAIAGVPSSARSPFGVSIEQAAEYLHHFGATGAAKYLHLTEAAPALAGADGARDVGRVLALMTLTFMKALTR